MNTERLEEFKVLANILNYSRAAEELYLSQSILSRHIKELEREIGVVLFDRDTHGVQLTEEGKHLLKWIEPLLEKTDSILAVLQSTEMSGEGNLRVRCAEQVLCTRIVEFMSLFKTQYPGIHMEFSPVPEVHRKEEIYESDIVLSSCDFAFVLGNVPSVQLTQQEPLLAIPPFHHLGDLEEIHLEDLSHEVLIVPFASELFSPFRRNAVLANRKCRNTVLTHPANSIEEALLLVELGSGVLMIPHHLKHHVFAHTRTIHITDPECLFPIFAYLNPACNNPIASLFLNKLSAFFGHNKPLG